MKTMTKYEVFETAIKGMSPKINKKALREVLADNEYNHDLNDILYKYYQRAHYVKDNNRIQYWFEYAQDFDSKEEFQEYMRVNYGAKRYKNDYDYKKLGRVRQKYTGMRIVYTNGFITWSSVCFDMDWYIEVNDFLIKD